MTTGRPPCGAATLLLPAVGRAGATEPFEPLGRLSVPGAKELVVDDGIAYVATTDGFATVDTSDPAEPTLLAERRSLPADHPDGPMAGVQDGKLHGDRYAVAGPANPLDDVPRAAVVFDVSDPAAPERVLVHETPFYDHNVDLDDETLSLCGNDGDRNPLVCVGLGTGETVGRWSVVDADDRWADVDRASGSCTTSPSSTASPTTRTWRPERGSSTSPIRPTRRPCPASGAATPGR
ncbi:hypothetical protein BRD05_04185 [Halobacteriales archaeon QS_9_70_65]|nr:MAG: hypothetical protein BRD05_04185 [Halobacteriales archaeon QS_9_70_65]